MSSSVPDTWTATGPLTRDGRLTLEGIARDGRYLSQFVTGTSNGGLTARPGGDRWRWESRLFGGAYDDAAAQEQPVHGALPAGRTVRGGAAVGAAPRFGSAYLRLSAATLARTTFCSPDSFVEPVDFGVASHMPLTELALAARSDALDAYVEAHVHGPVLPHRDAEALVLDPSHRGTAVEEAARALACPLEWHAGFRLTVEELRRHPHYRGPEHVELGTRLAVDGLLDPRVLGDAARSGAHDPQALKRVWHLLARFGAPEQPFAPRAAESSRAPRAPEPSGEDETPAPPRTCTA